MIMRKTYKHARRSGPSPVVILLAALLTVLCVNLAVVVALVRSTPEEPGEPMMEAVTTAPAAPVATEPREMEPVITTRRRKKPSRQRPLRPPRSGNTCPSYGRSGRRTKTP